MRDKFILEERLKIKVYLVLEIIITGMTSYDLLKKKKKFIIIVFKQF